MAVGVLFVCLGNICRSPVAQGMLEKKALGQGLENALTIDSCGTADFNIGKPPDPRAVAAASRAGYNIGNQFARQLKPADYQVFRYIVAMDRVILVNLQCWAPPEFAGELALLMSYYPNAMSQLVADPYYEAEEKFDSMIETMEPALDALLAHIKHNHSI